MSIAVTIDAGLSPANGWHPQPPDSVMDGVVAVREHGFAHSLAVCTCGWTGRRRYLKAAAEQDAWLHSIHEMCAVSVPLVLPAMAN
jgi:hypothetical protein